MLENLLVLQKSVKQYNSLNSLSENTVTNDKFCYVLCILKHGQYDGSKQGPDWRGS